MCVCVCVCLCVCVCVCRSTYSRETTEDFFFLRGELMVIIQINKIPDFPWMTS